jgi:hypothetical protein
MKSAIIGLAVPGPLVMKDADMSDLEAANASAGAVWKPTIVTPESSCEQSLSLQSPQKPNFF